MIDFVIPLPDPNASGWASFTDEDPPIYRWALTRNLGGSRPLPELFRASGLAFDFTDKTIAPLMHNVKDALVELAS